MWQPIFECTQGCKGCYVAASPSSRYSGRLRQDIIDLIYVSEAVRCDQFTISLDTLKQPHDALVTTLKWLWWFYAQGQDCGCDNVTRKSLNDKPLPELCITVRNWATLLLWAKWMDMSVSEFLQPLTLVSLSRFPVKRTTCEQMKQLMQNSKTVLNYNRLAEPIRRKAEFDNGTEFADHVYVVYQKKPLGYEQSEEALQQVTDIAGRATSRRADCKSIVIDKCLRDASKFNKSGFTCDAAIHKVHVWPDGSATGCPYDSRHVAVQAIRHRSLTHGYDTWDELQRAIVHRKCHPMELCKIPQMLKDAEKRRRSSVVHAKKKR